MIYVGNRGHFDELFISIGLDFDDDAINEDFYEPLGWWNGVGYYGSGDQTVYELFGFNTVDANSVLYQSFSVDAGNINKKINSIVLYFCVYGPEPTLIADNLKLKIYDSENALRVSKTLGEIITQYSWTPKGSQQYWPYIQWVYVYVNR
jgi:hypothetical protein